MTRLILKVVQNQVDLAVPVVGKLGQCGKISDASGVTATSPGKWLCDPFVKWKMLSDTHKIFTNGSHLVENPHKFDTLIPIRSVRLIYIPCISLHISLSIAIS